MEQRDKKYIGRITTTLLIIAATLGIAMAGGLVRWQEVTSFLKGDNTAKTAETKAKVEAAAKPSNNANYAHTTAFSGMPFTLTVEGATVHGEAGSLAEAAELSLSALDSVPPMAAGMVNVTRGAAGYRLSPSGMGFSKPVRVELGYDSLLLPKGHSAKEVRTFLYDHDNRRWEALPMDSVMEGAQKTGAQTTKAGELVNAIVQHPELPEAQSFTPSMLSKLEAAHPASGVTLIEAPQANSQGTANLSYPIIVPAGRGGLQPNLSVSYSSEAGNGLLGMGWDMQLPAITVDSKWGVPRYDDDYETECYSYNGAGASALTALPHTVGDKERYGRQAFPPEDGGFFRQHRALWEQPHGILLDSVGQKRHKILLRQLRRNLLRHQCADVGLLRQHRPLAALPRGGHGRQLHDVPLQQAAPVQRVPGVLSGHLTLGGRPSRIPRAAAVAGNDTIYRA